MGFKSYFLIRNLKLEFYVFIKIKDYILKNNQIYLPEDPDIKSGMWKINFRQMT